MSFSLYDKNRGEKDTFDRHIRMICQNIITQKEGKSKFPFLLYVMKVIIGPLPFPLLFRLRH